MRSGASMQSIKKFNAAIHPNANVAFYEIVISRSFSEKNSIQTGYVSRPFYISEIMSLKHFQLKIHHVEYQGKPMAIVAIHDITELEEQKKTIQSLANKDSLTGLDNRRSFFEVADALYQNAKRGNIFISYRHAGYRFFLKR